MQHPPKKRLAGPRSPRALILVLIAVLVLAAVFAALALRAQRKQPVAIVENPAYQVRTLELRQPASLASVSVSPSSGAPYELEMRDGHLCLVQPTGPVALDEEREQELLDALTQIVVQGTVAQDVSEVSEYLEDMGLAPARASATVRYTDGTEAKIEVGASVPHTTYAYYRWSGDAGVHMCDVGIADTLALNAERLLPVPDLQIHPSLVESLRLTNQSGELLFHFEGGASGTLESPFAYPLSSDGVNTLLSALQNFRLGAYQAVLTEENMAEYGFDHPLCVLDVGQKAGSINEVDENGALVTVTHEASQLRLSLGRAEGDYFYTCAYEGNCYLVSRFLVEALVKAQSGSHLTRNPALLADDTLARARLCVQGEEHLLEVERSERVLANNELATDAAGDVIWEVSALWDGESLTEEQLDAFEDLLSALTVAGDLPQNFVVLAADAEPRWTLTLETASGEVRTLEAYRMDAFSDALLLNGVARHYLHADAIDALLTFLPS